MADLEKFENNIMDFMLKLRMNNFFDEQLYMAIYEQLTEMVKLWKSQDVIPKTAFISCINLTDFLAGGSRFYPEDVIVKVEDASIAILELITSLEN